MLINLNPLMVIIKNIKIRENSIAKSKSRSQGVKNDTQFFENTSKFSVLAALQRIRNFILFHKNWVSFFSEIFTDSS